jgi:DNA-binding CsgD family transcriptional regulator
VTKPVTIDAKHERMLELLAEGASAREVAKKMGYSEGTTRVYLHNLYKLIGVRNKTEAAIFQLNRKRAEAPSAVAPAPVMDMSLAPRGGGAARNFFGELALGEDLYTALGVMASFLGPYGHVWEAGLRIKGTVMDEKTVMRRAQSRLLWRALLRNDFAYAKTLWDEGYAARLLVEQPGDAVLLACVLTIGGYSAAADRLVSQLQQRKRPGGITSRDAALLKAVQDAVAVHGDAPLAALHHAAEARATPILKQIAMVCLYHAYRARRDSERAAATATAIWAEAEQTRQQLEAMGVRPLSRDADLPHPTRAPAKTTSAEKVTAR